MCTSELTVLEYHLFSPPLSVPIFNVLFFLNINRISVLISLRCSR